MPQNVRVLSLLMGKSRQPYRQAPEILVAGEDQWPSPCIPVAERLSGRLLMESYGHLTFFSSCKVQCFRSTLKVMPSHCPTIR
jgi:hypothetical protein